MVFSGTARFGRGETNFIHNTLASADIEFHMLHFNIEVKKVWLIKLCRKVKNLIQLSV